MTPCVRVTECRLCDSKDLDLIYSFTPTPPGDQYVTKEKLDIEQDCYPLDLLVCRGCGAVQLADTVDPALIYTDYTYTTSISVGLDAHFARYADDVIKRVSPGLGGYVLDIGSNDGTMLKAFKARGYNVMGIDPAFAIAHRATMNGIPTQCGYLSVPMASSFRDNHGPASIITANHVMANVADLHDFIEGVKTLLAPDGTFVFETGYWPSIMRNRLIDTIEHEHIHYFAVAPLVDFFWRHELALVHVDEQPTKGGSIRGYVRHRPAVPDVSVRDLLVAHTMETLLILSEWARGLDSLRSQLRVVIDRKPKKERWLGYGAAVGSTLLLHHFGFGEALSELWDDNTSRHGLYSPGYHLPVVAPNSSSPDRIVLLAWRYAERIMAAHSEHAGKWLIPLPEVRVS